MVQILNLRQLDERLDDRVIFIDPTGERKVYHVDFFISVIKSAGYSVLASKRIHTRILLNHTNESFLIPTWMYKEIRGITNGYNPIKCGVELEFCCPRSAISILKERLALVVSFRDRSQSHGVCSDTSWVLTYDGSLSNGAGYQSFELVSPPMLVTDLSQLKAVLEVMNDLDCFVNRKCGTHVHFSFNEYLNKNKLTELYQCYHNWEFIFDKLVSPSRRNDSNCYCRTCVGSWQSSRYHKLNPCAYSKHGTVEVRQHQGTLSYSKISHWVALFCKWFNHYKENPSSFLEGLTVLGFTDSEKEWYLNRMAELE